MKRFTSLEREERPLIIAIDGFGGAGKTTFVNELAMELKKSCTVNVLHMDDHIVESEKRYNTGNEEWFEYYYLQWDITYFKKCLATLHCHQHELTLPFYNRASNTVTKKKIVFPPKSILLIEGIFLQRNEWRTFYDFTIFIECPFELRKERVLKRDTYLGDASTVMQKYEKRYWVAEAYYINKEHPLQIADLIWHAL